MSEEEKFGQGRMDTVGYHLFRILFNPTLPFPFLTEAPYMNMMYFPTNVPMVDNAFFLTSVKNQVRTRLDRLVSFTLF